ncbi:MAG: zf-TFIIB domain-containing protein [Calditrichaeota bacterium]|nr:zf-TFIIB domain-containing protein [Calditrichota bacterium]
MDCPVCKTPMLILEYQQIEIDYCPSCQGIWLDQGELELLLKSENSIVDLSNFSNHSRSNRRCPRCRKKMVKGPFPDSAVEVDICPRDSGIWLDRGEIEQIAGGKKFQAARTDIQRFFKELFQYNSERKED